MLLFRGLETLEFKESVIEVTDKTPMVVANGLWFWTPVSIGLFKYVPNDFKVLYINSF